MGLKSYEVAWEDISDKMAINTMDQVGKVTIKKGILSILLQREGDCFVAHCLDFDIVTQGKTQEEAMKELFEEIKEFILYVEETGATNLLRRKAPEEYWDRYSEIKNRELRVNSSEFTLDYAVSF